MAMERFKVFLQLEGGVKLLACQTELSLSYSLNRSIGLTCASGINGGPAAISNALLPDLTRRVTPVSSPCSSFEARLNCPALSSEPGPNWTSVSGGGLGSRGEVAAAICAG